MKTLIEVKGCHDCPFLGEEYEQRICTLIAYRGLTWKDNNGFDELYEEGRLPDSCPLRKQQITIGLKEYH